MKALATRGHERSGRDAMPYVAARVTLADVARRLGKTRPALYRLWPTHHDFWVDLTLYLVYQNDFSQPADRMPWTVARAEQERHRAQAAADDVDAWPVGGNVAQDVVFDDIWILVRAALIGYPDVPGIAALRRQVEERRLRDLADYASHILQATGRTTRDPLSEYDVAVTMWCLSDGLSIANRWSPQLADQRLTLDGDASRSWGLLSYALRSAVIGMSTLSEPRSEHRPEPWQCPPTIEPDVRWSPLQLEALAAATAEFLESLREPRTDGEGDLGVLAHVTISRVASAAGVSRQAVYGVWPTRRAMMLDLLRELLDDQRQLVLRGFERSRSGGAGSEPVSIEEILHDATPAGLIDPHLAYLTEVNDPGVRAVVDEGHGEFMDEVANRIDSLLGGPLVDGISPRHLATIWVALLGGGRRLLRTNPDALRAEPHRPTLGVATWALVHESLQH